MDYWLTPASLEDFTVRLITELTTKDGVTSLSWSDHYSASIVTTNGSRSGNRTHLGVLMRHFSSTRTVSC